MKSFLDSLLTGAIEAGKQAIADELKNLGVDLTPTKEAAPSEQDGPTEAGETIDPEGSIETEGYTVEDEPTNRPQGQTANSGPQPVQKPQRENR